MITQEDRMDINQALKRIAMCALRNCLDCGHFRDCNYDVRENRVTESILTIENTLDMRGEE